MSLPSLSPYTFGAMSLGSDLDLLDQHLAVAHQAIAGGGFIHASPTYHRGFSFLVLRLAFEQLEGSPPPLIIKIRDGSPTLMRFETEDTCRRLGIDSIAIAQLVSMSDDIAPDLARGGPLAAELQSLKSRGLIRSAVLFLNRGQPGAIQQAWDSGLIDGVTFYWNATQRACSDEDYQFILDRQIPILALRTLGGPPTESPLSPARQMELLQKTGCATWTELNIRLACTHPLVKTTIGGTANPAHLAMFLESARQASPLSTESQSLFPELFPNFPTGS